MREGLHMNVKKIVLLFGLLVLFTNCDNNKSSGSRDNFIKTDTPTCADNVYRGEYLVHWQNGDITVEKSENDETFRNEFLEKHKDEILLSEPHYRVQIEKSVRLNQSAWGGYPNWGMDVIGASELWLQSSAPADVLVAVIDSGVDIEHPELKEAIYHNVEEEDNGIDDDGNGLVDDIHGYNFVVDSGVMTDYTGHGTHVAGVIAARHDVGEVTGVAPNVKILPIAFISNTGGGSVSAAINSIRYAAHKNAKVINASWGGPSCSTVLKTEIESLAAQDILFITAAGNSGNNLEELPEYPAAFLIDNMLTVGASALQSDDSQVMASFSNFGELVDLMAPGADITSTYPPEFDGDDVLDGLATINGTSMATPHVAGAAALLWSLKPNASYGAIKQALLNGVQKGPFRVKTRGSLYLPTALEILEQ